MCCSIGKAGGTHGFQQTVWEWVPFSQQSPELLGRHASRFNVLRSLHSLSVWVGAPLGIFFARNFLGVTLRETAIDLFFTSVLGVTLLLGTSRWKLLVNLKPLQFLGKISYGVYLTHMLIFEFVAQLSARIWPAMRGEMSRFGYVLLQFCISATLTLAVTYLSRLYFEEPFLRLKDRYDCDRSLPSPTKALVRIVPEMQLEVK